MKTFFSHKKETKTNTFFGEERLVFFAGDNSGQGGGEPPEDNGGIERPRTESTTPETQGPVNPNAPTEGAGRPTGPEVKKPVEKPRGTQVVSGETMQQISPILESIDMAEVQNILPKEQLESIKDDVYGKVEQLDEINTELTADLKEFRGELEGEIGDTKEFDEELWIACYSVVPELDTQNLSKLDIHIVPSIDKDKLYSRIGDLLEAKGLKHSDVWSIVNKIAPKLNIATEHEWRMISELMKLQKALSDVNDVFRKRSYKETLIEKEGRTLGFPLKPGTKLKGIDAYLGADENVVEDEMTYEILEVEVDKAVEEEGEKVKYNGVVIKIRDDKTGEEKWWPMSKVKYLVDTMDLVPIIQNGLEDVHHMTKLNELGVELQEGMRLDYVEVDRNQDGSLNKRTNQVMIEKIDEEKIYFDKDVVYRLAHQSQDLGSNDEKSELTHEEFIKWFNQRSVIPAIDMQGLEQRLKWLTKNLNQKYNRTENAQCFRPINLEAGEIIYIDSKSKKLFEIESVDENEIKLKDGQTFTPTDFFRWLYENEVEPFDPELEVLKAKEYGGITDEEQLKEIKDKADSAIKHFQESGMGDDIMKKIEDATKDRKDNGEGILDGQGRPMPIDKMILSDPQLPSSGGKIGAFWKSIDWLRPSDIGEFFKKCWEVYNRKWSRKQAGRYSGLGRNLPYFGPEFESINQQTENEEVSQYQLAMEQWGIWQIEDVLYTTTNQDQAKACINVLASKGMIRWDDPRLWTTLNQFNPESYQVPFPGNSNDPYVPYESGKHHFSGVGDVGGKTGMDLLPNALDNIWGEGSYNGWFGDNKGAIQQGIQRGLDKAKDLEGDPKSLGAAITSELALLLERHVGGEYVDPWEYEGLLRWCYTAGKSSPEGKTYYMLMGLAAKNPQGRSLLSWDRKGTLGSDVMINFPLIDYYSSAYKKRHPSDPTKIINEPIRQEHLAGICEKWKNMAIDGNDFYPPKELTQFMQKDMMLDKNFQDRLEKTIRHPENLDHDDAHLWIPALKENMVEKACSTITGNKSAFTVPGLRNAYAGYGMRIKFINERLDEDAGTELEPEIMQQLVDTILSYVRFDSVLWEKYNKSDNRLQRLTDSDMEAVPVIDPGTKTKVYKQDMDGFMHNLVDKMGEHGLSSGADLEQMQTAIAEPGTVNSQSQENAIKTFRKPLIKAVTGNSKKFRTIVRDFIRKQGGNFGLRGSMTLMEQIQESGKQNNLDAAD